MSKRTYHTRQSLAKQQSRCLSMPGTEEHEQQEKERRLRKFDLLRLADYLNRRYFSGSISARQWRKCWKALRYDGGRWGCERMNAIMSSVREIVTALLTHLESSDKGAEDLHVYIDNEECKRVRSLRWDIAVDDESLSLDIVISKESSVQRLHAIPLGATVRLALQADKTKEWLISACLCVASMWNRYSRAISPNR